MPYFSVIVPSYNRGTLLPRCLDSLRRQGFADFEVVVVDDGSSDDTRNVVERFAAADGRFRYIYQDHSGAADARNHGAAVAIGRFLVFLDSDDEVLPEWLERFRSRLDREQAQIVCCGCRFLDERGQVDHERLPVEPSSPDSFRWGFFFTGTFAIDRAVFQAVGGYASGLPANQHSELRLRLLPQCPQRGWKVACVQQALVLRYSHGGASIRKNVRAVYESGVFILTQHGHVFGRSSGAFSTWAATIGSCAARLREYPEARRWFLRAVAARPYRWKNYARLATVCLPGIRSLVWRRSGNLNHAGLDRNAN